MKALWFARLARPDCLRPIFHLATKVSCWTRNDDRKLYRLMCYISSTLDLQLTGYVRDDPKDLYLELYCDADYGNPTDARSTTGGWLVLRGPNTDFPLAWTHHEQHATFRSTKQRLLS